MDWTYKIYWKDISIHISFHSMLRIVFDNFQKSFENAEYGGDLDTVQSLAEEHEHLHQEVLRFKKEVDQCISDGVTII